MRSIPVRARLIAIPIRPILAGTVVAGTILTAPPAHAAPPDHMLTAPPAHALTASPDQAEVTFDFTAHTGFAGADELRQAFGWDAPTLRRRATGIAFTSDTLVQDVYAVVCGPAGTPPVRAVHARQFGTWFLTKAIDRDARGEIRGLRITGAEAGISGTTVPPTPDMPCPSPALPPPAEATPPPATATPPSTAAPQSSTAPQAGAAAATGTIRTVTLVSTTTTMTLIAKSGDTARELVELRNGPEITG